MRTLNLGLFGGSIKMTNAHKRKIWFFCKSSFLSGFLLFFNPKRKTYKVSLGQSESGPGFHDFDQHFSLANFTPPCNLYFKCIELGAKCKSENVNDLNRFEQICHLTRVGWPWTTTLLSFWCKFQVGSGNVELVQKTHLGDERRQPGRAWWPCCRIQWKTVVNVLSLIYKFKLSMQRMWHWCCCPRAVGKSERKVESRMDIKVHSGPKSSGCLKLFFVMIGNF